MAGADAPYTHLPFFYSDLFIKHPEVRDLFPVSMEAQRGHLVDALVTIVSQVDSVAELTAFLQGLGRDHRKFGALAEHYDAVGAWRTIRSSPSSPRSRET